MVCIPVFCKHRKLNMSTADLRFQAKGEATATMMPVRKLGGPKTTFLGFADQFEIKKSH